MENKKYLKQISDDCLLLYLLGMLTLLTNHLQVIAICKF